MNYINPAIQTVYGTLQVLDHFIGRQNVNKVLGKVRYRTRMRILAELRKKGGGKVVQLDEVHGDYLKELRRYVRDGVPVVLKGAAKSWPCVQKWSLDYFKEKHGDDRIVMADQSNIANEFDVHTLREVIDDIQGGKGTYYRFYPLLKRHPEHLLDVDYQFLRKVKHSPNLAEAFQVFIGGAGTETPLHNASACNLFVQVHGRKKWVLYSNHFTPAIDPASVRNLYRSAPIRTDYYFNPFDPDYKNYPDYEHMLTWEVELEPGDILWNPPFVWHTIKNPTDSIGVGYRWIPPFYCMRRSPLYFTLDLFATKPPIWKSLGLMKEDMNLVHLAETGRLEQAKSSLGNE